MIYVKGENSLIEQLGTLELTESLENATCAVIEMPGNENVFTQLPLGLPVLVIIDGMMSLADTKTIRKFNAKVIKREEIAKEIRGLQKTLVENTIVDDDIMFFDEDGFQERKTKEPTLIERAVEPPQNFLEEPWGMMHNQTIRQTCRLTPKRETITMPTKDTHESLSKEIPKPRILAPRMSRGLVVASYSSSGGVGKTFMACSVSALCAMHNISTVLVDLDLGFGNVDIETGLVDEIERNKALSKKTMPRSNWVTVTDWRKHAVDLKSNTLCHSSGLYVVPSFPYAGRELPEAEIEDLLHTFSEIYDLVVIDLGVDGFSNQARVALRMSNAILIVAGQDPKTIGKLTHFLSQEGGKNDRMHLVFNKRTPTGFYNPKEIAKKMEFNRYYSIPLDKEGVNAARIQHKLVVQIPGSSAGEAVKNFAAAVLPFNIEAGEIVQSKKRSFLTKLMAKFKKA